MTRRFSFHAAADKDIDEIAEYFIEHGVPQTAWRFIDQTEVTAQNAVLFPKMYTAHPYFGELVKGFRRCPMKEFRNYTMYYEIEEDGSIIVMGIFPGMRDHSALLKGRRNDDET